MRIIKTVSVLREILDKEDEKMLAFVPTLGALHYGHMTLIEKAKELGDLSLVSIFVNPLQFNDEKDLEKYPRPIEQDIAKLEEASVDILFHPERDEVYPEGLDSAVGVDLGNLDKVLEGEYREGHFDGMMRVVNRLLNIVKPDFLIMGQKDIQQFQIVRRMLKSQDSDVSLIRVPTVREDSGLAMSSRNKLLSERGRETAAVLYETLLEVKTHFHEQEPEQLLSEALMKIRNAGLEPEYLSLVNSETFETVDSVDDETECVLAVAAYLEGVRLIDNVIFNEN